MSLTPNELRFIAKHPHLEGRVRGIERVPPPQGPGLLQQAVNFAGAVTRYVTQGGFKIPLGMAEERHADCRTCDMYIQETDRCRHIRCGCDLKEKTLWSTERCPKKKPKWDRVSAEQATAWIEAAAVK